MKMQADEISLAEQSVAGRRSSKESAAVTSTYSDASNTSYEMRRPNNKSSYHFGMERKTRQSQGAYTTLFSRKLLPPLGFYREVDKYNSLKAKFRDDPFKTEALDEMWGDYQKYQIRKRFRWPPHVICKKFFWTTGYYPDYQKKHRATKLRMPGEDSSDEEFMGGAGRYMIAGNEDINVEEFERYRQAKRGEGGQMPIKKTAFDDTTSQVSTDTVDTNANAVAPAAPRKVFQPKVEEEVETIVEYTLVRDPNKKRKSSLKDQKKGKKGKGKGKDDDSVSVAASEISLMDLEAGEGKRVVTRRKSVAVTDPTTGETVTTVAHESSEIQSTSKKGSKKPPKK